MLANDTATMHEVLKSHIAQIKEKGYATPYLNNEKPITLIGINFSKRKRNSVEWVEEEMAWITYIPN